MRTESEELEFNDVSCPKMTACVAVGEAFVEAGPDDIIVQHWDGGTWYRKDVPLPGTADQISELTAVDCVTPSDCWTVGTAVVGSRATPMASRFDGATWKSRTLPTLRNMAGAILNDVDCVPGATLTSCMAVGLSARSLSEGAWDPYAAIWSPASGWSLLKVPKPAPGDAVVLTAVSCPAANACIVSGGRVAADSPSPSFSPFSASWDGTVWSILPTPLPRGADAGALADIDCASTRYCVAVGYQDLLDSSDRRFAAYHWNGNAWSIKPTPALPGLLSGVSCAAKSFCVAVGETEADSPVYENQAAIRWNAQAWAVESLAPSPAGPSSELLAVSCPSSTRCTAVGSAGLDELHRSLLVQRYA